VDVVSEQKASCTAPGVTDYRASYTLEGRTWYDTQIIMTSAELGHDYGSYEFKWNDAHSQCTAVRTCKRDATHQESFVCGEITASKKRAATCSAGGITTYTALFSKMSDLSNVSVDVEDSVVDPSNHVGGTEVKNVKKSTCTENGYSGDTYCKGCGTILKSGTVIPCSGHEWDSGTITKEPTCASEGSKTIRCKNCSTVKETISIPKLDHQYVTTVTQATDSSNGSTAERCTVCGAIENETEIYAPQEVSLSFTSAVYRGEEVRPTVTVKDANGNVIASDSYSVTFQNNKNVGVATAMVTFSGNYSGTITKNFTIVPKSVTKVSVKAMGKGFKLTWKKQATQTSGYQIQYSTSSNFKKSTSKLVKSNKTTSTTIKGLASRKKYYVRIRTYKIVNGKKVYSAWSATKRVTTKK
jgi:methionine-rich copper-binding protein CopC